jgi:predicted class III extradiol MEMO1 family dioxygenase
VLLEYSQDVPQALVDYLQSRPNFVEHYSPQKGKIMFVFRLTKDVKERYTDKILAGKYSEADKQVVDKYFPNDPSHFRYGNRLIIEKSERWKEYWETKIGLPLPVDAEVYPRPQAKNEVYGYVPTPSDTPKSGEQRTLIKPAI